MYTRYYDGYTGSGAKTCQGVQDTSENTACSEDTQIANIEDKPIETSITSAPGNLPFNMKADDIMLIAVLLLIASESNDDFILPIILGYLLIG